MTAGRTNHTAFAGSPKTPMVRIDPFREEKLMAYRLFINSGSKYLWSEVRNRTPFILIARQQLAILHMLQEKAKREKCDGNQPREHVFEKHDNCELVHCMICDGGLQYCIVCRDGEGDLQYPCPGPKAEYFRSAQNEPI